MKTTDLSFASLLRRMFAIFSICMLMSAFQSCGGDEPENPNDQPGNGDKNVENDASARVGRYEGKVYCSYQGKSEYEGLTVTLQLNSDGSGYYLESRADCCNRYLYFTNHEFDKGNLWIMYGDGQERHLGRCEGNRPEEFVLTLEPFGYRYNTPLRRVTTANDTKKYTDSYPEVCVHDLETGNVIGYYYCYEQSSTGETLTWFLGLYADNTYRYLKNRTPRRGTYEISGHTLRLYYDGNYTPYNVVFYKTNICWVMLENGKNQHIFTRISEAEFKKWVGN